MALIACKATGLGGERIPLRHRFLLIAVALFRCSFAPGCGNEGQVPAEVPGRVLIVGIDGASPEVIGPMMEEGRLPNLKRLADAGAWGPLRSLSPLLSPRIWTTIATGKSPFVHGVENWVTPLEPGPRRLLNSHDRRVHALWNIVSDAGLTVGTVNWLMTYPPEPVHGVVVSDLALPGAANRRTYIRDQFASEQEGTGPVRTTGPTTYPEDWSARVVTLAGAAQPLTDIPDPFKGNTRIPEEARGLSESAYASDESLARIALDVDERLKPDVTMVLLQGIDRTSHWLWGGLEPPEIYPAETRYSPEEREAAATAVRTYYEFTDTLLGRLLERHGEKDLVLVLSDHGFEGVSSFSRMTGGHKSERAMDGVLFARGPGIAPGTILEKLEVTVLDITPTVLAWLGLPVAADMEGHPASFLTLAHPVRHIATYETKPVPRLPFAPAGVEDNVIEGLHDLGYLK